MKLILLLLCIQPIVFVNCGNCELKSYLLNETADQYTEWSEKQLENNHALYPNVLPTINAKNAWILNSENNSVTITAPSNTGMSLYQFKVDSIEIQTATNIGDSSCYNLTYININWFRIYYVTRNYTVSFDLPNMGYDLGNEELRVKIPLNPFTSPIIKIQLRNITGGTSTCIRFDLIGTILSEVQIIGYELTMASELDLPDYQLSGLVCDKAYNICSGGISYLIDKSENSSLQEMEDPKNRLKWNCNEGKECFIKIRIIFDYKVKVRFPSKQGCHTGETSVLGFYEDYQLYKESFQNINSAKSRVFEFDICVESGESADIYSVDLYDKYLKRINFKYACVSKLTDINASHETAIISVSLIAILISISLVILTIIFIRKYLEQKKLILCLTDSKVNSKWKQMRLPLAPERSDSRFLQSGFYYEIGDNKPLIEPNRKESQIKFTENIGLYGKINTITEDMQDSQIFESTTTTTTTTNESKIFTNTVYKSFKTGDNQLLIDQDELNEVSTNEFVYSKRDTGNKKESFSQYNNLDHN